MGVGGDVQEGEAVTDKVDDSAEDLVCPFCGTDDFDALGLKNHLQAGDCKAYNDTPTLAEEAAARRRVKP